MGQPYVGEIRMFGGSFAPAGWALCDGALLPISENDVLFQLIGTTYGGDGQENFALPNLQSRVPIHQGQGAGASQGYQVGETGGVDGVTLSTSQLPVHTHSVNATSTGQQLSPQNATFATATSTQAGVKVYGANANTQLVGTTVQGTGGSQPHDNIQPSLAVTFIISLFGIFPSPT